MDHARTAPDPQTSLPGRRPLPRRVPAEPGGSRRRRVDLAEPGTGGWDDPPAVRLPYSHSFGDLVVSVTLLRNGTPVDPYLWDSWRACLPPGGITARRAYTATERFLAGYYGATGCVEADTLRRYMALPSETDDLPALWGRWTACIAMVLSTPNPPRRRSADPPDDPTSW